jgi:hypothetical protein
MAITISLTAVTGNTYVSMPVGTKQWTIGSITTGKGLILVMPMGKASGTGATVTAASLSTDGSAQQYTATFANGISSRVAFAVWPNITAASQTLSVTTSGDSTEGAPYFFEVSGHDTSDVMGNEATANTSPIALTIQSSGNAALVYEQGNNPDATTFGGAGGSWTVIPNIDSYGLGAVGINTTINSGAQSITATQTINLLGAIEIKASGGAGGGIPKSTKFLMTGIG